jgi:hypothetical protein
MKHMWWWDRLIEDKIQEARRDGYFDRLKGEGKPLRDDQSDLAGDDWLAHHLMQEAGVLPEWLSLRKDIAERKPRAMSLYNEAVERLNDLPNRLWPTDARLRRLISLYKEHMSGLNLLIDQHNHRCPSIQHELVRVREDAIERARDRIRAERVTQYVRGLDAESDQ